MQTIPKCLGELHSILQSESRLVIDLPEGFKRAAVLIPFVCREKNYSLIFTRRTSDVTHHKNEISFPGGRYEDDLDRDLIQTALREADEELGIKNVRVIGLLDDLLTISKYVVTPVVGHIDDKEEVDPNNVSIHEIDYILETQIRELALPEIFSVKEMTYQNDFVFLVPFFDYGGEIIWGATGRILVNLLSKLNLLSPKCRHKLMGQNSWNFNSMIDNGLEYIENLDLLKRKS
ncbi:MAG: CoA pyrophosphatase [Candidatus Heimdallarchaeota archaeon]|nr:MAG: CoA pyrophosphatase [Candidatus Heimdallarchaeota archaeon]